MRRFMTVLLVLVPAVTAASFFLYSRQLPLLESMARVDVVRETRGQMRRALLEEAPGLDLKTAAKMVDASWEAYGRQHRQELREKIEGRTRALKDQYRDEAGQAYMPGIDSYHWLRHLENLMKTGRVGDRLEKGQPYDSLASRSVDAWTRRNVHLYLARPLAWLAVRTGRPLTSTLVFLPVAMLFAVAASSFACAKRIGASDLGAFVASFSITLSPFLFSRVCAEWFDTDIYNVFFPLAILATYLISLDDRGGRARRASAAAAAGVLVGLYAITWQGWWFIFDIIVLASGMYFLNLHEVCRQEGRDPGTGRRQLGMFGIFFGSSILAVMLLNGPAVCADVIREPARLSHLFQVTRTTPWPNVYLTVDELGPASVAAVVRSLGGIIFFFVGLLGLCFLVLREHALRHPAFGCGLMCVVLWLVIPFPVALQAMRFTLLLVAPVGLAFGLAVGRIREGLETWVGRRDIRPAVRTALRGLFLLFVVLYLFLTTGNGFAIAYGTLPQLNDTWTVTLSRIREKTPDDSVINSWWDFGHWFKTLAARRVLFDGMTQNSPYAYWTARVLLMDDEAAAARILKMLDADGHEGVDRLVEKLGGPGAAVRFTEQLMAAGPQAARPQLAAVLAPEEVDAVESLLFPRTAPPAYFIVSFDMLNKIAAISFIGNWDFRNVDLWLKGRVMPQERFLDYARQQYNLTPQESLAAFWDARSLSEKDAHSWFSSIIGYGSALQGSQAWEGLWMFENGIVVDWPKKRAYVIGAAADKRGVPQSLLYLENGVFHQEPQPDATLKFSVLIVREGEKIKAILVPPELGRSLLLRLYYLKGEGLKHFRLWSEEADEKGNAVYVYEMVWPD
ncbi:MAG: STT3 domain-containing protein [Deltaproteobacteria bacterium]